MIDTDALQQRGRALEDEFFHRVDQKLLENMRQKREHDEQRRQLSAATGFENDELLDHLLEAGFESSTIAALTLVPLVFVAWADGSVTAKEHQTVISAALHRGVDADPNAFAMLEGWLQKRPPRSLWRLWKEYAASIGTSLTPVMAETLLKELRRLATLVAEASGGKLGFGKVSAMEQAILDEMESLVP